MENNLRLEKIVSGREFEKAAVELFRDQFKNVGVYREYCELLNTDPYRVTSVEEIPYLPIEIFKTHSVVRNGMEIQKTFESSGTTGAKKSRHAVVDLSLYRWSLRATFNQFFGDPANYCILALLPGYLERDNASLVYMVNDLMQISKHHSNGFYLDDMPALVKVLHELQASRQPAILFGVSFALLDLAAAYNLNLPDVTIIETGGMKGRRKEITREALHHSLSQSLMVKAICSEYGMTELLSQAYAPKHGLFRCPPWMKILVRDSNDPFFFPGHDTTGGINIIDLANRHSCAFIATQDLGRTNTDGSFEVLGRFDHSDLRGCNLMVE